MGFSVLEILDNSNRISYMTLSECIIRNDEVVGSIPTSSTNLLNHLPSFSAICAHQKITGCGTFWSVNLERGPGFGVFFVVARRIRRPSKNRGPGKRSRVLLARSLCLRTPRAVATLAALVFLRVCYRLRTSNCTGRATELISGS